MAEVNVAELPVITEAEFTVNDRFLIVDDGKIRLLTKAVFESWVANNLQGTQGKQGVAGSDGVDGKKGADGVDGKDGLSAYQLFVNTGFKGSVDGWKLSLKGSQGIKGIDGSNGWTPVIKTVERGSDTVLYLSDWVSGAGTKPTLIGYIGATGVVSNIANATNIRGNKGNTGASGSDGEDGADGEDGGNGWSPVFQTENTDGGSYLKVVDWVGGTGTKPRLVGYVSDDGIVDTVATANTLRGVQGEKGEKGDSGTSTGTGSSETAETIKVKYESNEDTNAFTDLLKTKLEQMQMGGLFDDNDGNPLKVWTGTQTEYDLVSEKDSGTIYLITGGVVTPDGGVFDAEVIAAAIDELIDRNILTDAERTKLKNLPIEGVKGEKGEKGDSGNGGGIIDNNDGSTLSIWTGTSAEYDLVLEKDSGTIYLITGEGGFSETSETIKTKYESNLNTNAFTDSNKSKLEQLQLAPPFLRVFNNRLEGNDSAIARGATVIKNGVGDYTVSNTSGLITDRLSVLLPKDINGNYKVAAVVTERSVGIIDIKTYVRKFVSATGDYEPDLTQPLDIPTGYWVELWLVG